MAVRPKNDRPSRLPATSVSQVIAIALFTEGLDGFRETKFIMIDPDCTDTQDSWWFPYKDEESFPG